MYFNIVSFRPVGWFGGLESPPYNGQKAQIQRHLNKANIVPIDLRFMNTLNRATILQYLQTLTQQQQKQLMIILD